MAFASELLTSMKNNDEKKELRMRYEERKRVGGVFVIRNTLKDKLLLDATTDVQRSRNRFEFTQKTGSCADLPLQKDWTEQAGRGFVFELLEDLEKGETQTEAEFGADIKLLKELWLQKLAGKDFY